MTSGSRPATRSSGACSRASHRRRVAFGMMPSRNVFLCCGGPSGEPGRDESGDQQADGQHDGRRRGNGRDDRGCRQRQHHRDANRHQCAHQHVGQLVDVGADPGHQFTAVQPDGGRRRSARQPSIDLHPRGAGRAQGRVVGGQSLAIVQHPPRDREHANRDRRHRQVQHGRHLPGARDQPCRNTGQGQRTAQREHPERNRRQDARQPGTQQVGGGQQQRPAAPGSAALRSPRAHGGDPTRNHAGA